MRHLLDSLFRSRFGLVSRRHFLRAVAGGGAVLGAASVVGREVGPAVAPTKPVNRPVAPAEDEFDPVSDPGWTA